jgi:hypothetical protein
MPAPDIKTVYKFEYYVEPAVRTALLAAGLPGGSVSIARGTGTLATPSTSVSLRMGGVNGHRFAPPTLNYWVFDQYACAVDITLRANRSTDSSHDDYRAIIRACIVNIFANVSGALPYHGFEGAPRELGTNISTDEENNHDLSSISFGTVLGIKPGAWPVA